MEDATMTLEEFAKELKALLRKAEDSGLEVEDFCQLAEEIVAEGWGETDTPI